MINLNSGLRPRSNSQHIFSQVPKAEIPRSSFDRSHSYKTAFDAGYLIPIFVDEALPGDTFNLSLTAFARLATPIFPIMDNMYMDTHFFSVPYRLVWDNWQRFQGEQKNPGDSTDFIIPQLVSPAGGYAVSSIHDYMGLPPLVPNLSHSALWHRAYNLIYNEWFRDQNLQDSLPVPTDDGPDDPADYSLVRRGKRHDYFTSCLPWPQKGQAVQIPLGTTAPVYGDGHGLGLWNGIQTFGLVSGASGQDSLGISISDYNKIVGSPRTGVPVHGNNNIGVVPSGLDSGLYADLSNATAATINSLRQAFQIQRVFERDARGGTRYIEMIKSHFGVSSPDARLQRPEYLGGGSTPVNVTPIPQTSSTGVGDNPMGTLSGVGTATVHGNGFTTSFTEHCLVIGLVSVRADLTYQQGVNRMWWRRTRFDFYLPALAHLGEQVVYQGEIYSDGTVEDLKVFGYQERFAEYRYKPSMITGLLRSAAPQSLDAWHLAQDFQNAPVLDSNFISENPPIDRVIAVPSEPHFIFDSQFNLRCARPMPLYSVPGLIDHF